MSDIATAASGHAELSGDQVIVLRDVGWADYQRLLEIRDERPTPRLTYLEGVLELMTPSQPHESIKSMLGRLVEAWCLERGVGITPYGSWTHESKEADRGIEPDECYAIGDVPHPQRADLAIEVEWTRGALDKLVGAPPRTPAQSLRGGPTPRSAPSRARRARRRCAISKTRTRFS